MSFLPIILLIDNNAVSEKIIGKALAESAQLIHVPTIEQASDAISRENIDLILINADTYGLDTSSICEWLKCGEHSSQLKLAVLSQDLDSQKEMKFFQSGADDVIELPAPLELLKVKIMRHTATANRNNTLEKASSALNRFYANTYRNDSIGQCLSECLEALKEMNINGALHICDHPELTCTSYGLVNDYEKSLLLHANNLSPAEDSARISFGDDTLSILIQDLPNSLHPHYKSLTDWVNKLFLALSYKVKTLLAPRKKQKAHKKIEEVAIPKTTKGAQRLHYYLERAVNQMESSCEQEFNRTIGRVEELSTWQLTPLQKRHIFQLKDNLMQLKETLMVNCLEIESRYFQFITERRATTRLNLGW